MTPHRSTGTQLWAVAGRFETCAHVRVVLALACTLGMGAGACASGRFRLSPAPAVGRPQTCGAGAVDLDGSERSGTDARCSYADRDGELVQLRGRVRYLDLVGAMPRAVVALRRADGRGETRRIRVDHDGRFSLSATFATGRYIADLAEGGRARPVEVEIAAGGQVTPALVVLEASAP